MKFCFVDFFSECRIYYAYIKIKLWNALESHYERYYDSNRHRVLHDFRLVL